MPCRNPVISLAAVAAAAETIDRGLVLPENLPVAAAISAGQGANAVSTATAGDFTSAAAAVPEPPSLVLTFVGIGLLGACWHRR